METIKLIQMGILNDDLSFLVFVVLCSLFIIDMGLYMCIWINLLVLNWQVNKAQIYQEPMKNILQGFEELLDFSTHQVNTRAYAEDFFSSYKVTIFPLFKIPVISTIKFIKNTISLFILVGVLGTFIGIYTSLVKVLNSGMGETEGITQVLTGLDSITPVLSGMGTAFATSIVGMSFALLTTFILKLFNAEQFLYGVMARLVNYLDNEVRTTKKSFMAKSLHEIETTIKNGFKDVNQNIRDVFNNTFEHLIEQFEQCEGVSEAMKEVAINSEKLQNMSVIPQQSLLMQNIYEEQKEMVEVYGLLQEKETELKLLIEKTLEQQQKIATDYDQILKNINSVQEKFEIQMDNNTEQFRKTMSYFRNSFNKEMNKNVSTFAEHVELSNELINKGFDSIINKFDNMDLILGKYLSGLAFNASDLEDTIEEMKKAVKSLEVNLKQHNQTISELKTILQENKNSVD